MKRLALKIDVDTYRGTLHGVPALIELLRKHQAQATFLFSLGPDHTGRAIRHVFRPGFMKKVRRASVIEHYGLLTLMYGTLLPGPDIGKRCAGVLRSVRDAGFEVGIHCWNQTQWRNNIATADNAQVEAEMGKACQRFKEIFGEKPSVHGAAGWQMNRHALRLTQRKDFVYSSDSRGEFPFIPVIDGEIVACPQLPTTLPTLDELIGINGLTTDTVADHLLQLTATAGTDQIFTLRAEFEGMKLIAVLDKLLTGWKAQGFELLAMRDIHTSLELKNLARHEVLFTEIPGRPGKRFVQGPEFLGSH
jgi:peptidoglycan/xylan/chitin deacetylase (PgdA/CDA1 family)